MRKDPELKFKKKKHTSFLNQSFQNIFSFFYLSQNIYFVLLNLSKNIIYIIKGQYSHISYELNNSKFIIKNHQTKLQKNFTIMKLFVKNINIEQSHEMT